MALVRHAALDIHSMDGRIGSDLMSESLPLDLVQEVCGADIHVQSEWRRYCHGCLGSYCLSPRGVSECRWYCNGSLVIS